MSFCLGIINSAKGVVELNLGFFEVSMTNVLLALSGVVKGAEHIPLVHATPTSQALFGKGAVSGVTLHPSGSAWRTQK